jgi:hypothetical protein
MSGRADQAANRPLDEPPSPISSQDGEEKSLAHQLTNDLCVIIGQCDLLSGLCRETDVLARLEVVKKTAQRMAERISSGNRP